MSVSLDARIAHLESLLALVAREHSPATLACSLSVEDLVLADAIGRLRLAIEVFVLDTGRLHGDTLALIGKLGKRNRIELRVVKPQPMQVREYVLQFGSDAFYRSVELRKRCCEIRKVEPLGRALAGKRAWVTGLRRAQSVGRGAVALREQDRVHGLVKFNPLADWSEDDVWACQRRYDVPYNALYDQGYRSIGCAPCSRPVVAGEDPRAGRWWWEATAPSECGLHVAPDGRRTRARQAA